MKSLKLLLKEHLLLIEEWGEYGHLIPDQNKRAGRTFTDQFIQSLGSQQFKDVIEKVKKYTQREDVDISQLSPLFLNSIDKIKEIESEHIPQLEKLAVDLVKDNFKIQENTIDFDVKITDNVDILNKIANIEKQEITPEILSKFKSKESFDSMVKKRRLINAMTQGMATKGFYMFHLIDKQLNKIDPQLINLYGIMASLSELGYWAVPEEYSAQALQSEVMKGGGVKVDLSGEIPKIIARGKNFSVILHEIIKGVMELMSLSGFAKQKDPEKIKHILGQADYLRGEAQDLRFGPKVWEKFMESIPDDATDLVSYIYNYVVSLKHREFNELMNEIIKGTNKSKEWMKNIVDEIKKEEL